ncbi:hypothetical protein F4782DRAFT_503149 [Xylaria castorea]|nr:hypothetical protein F4782DRAFT_503149 [Xylaria castorea]
MIAMIAVVAVGSCRSTSCVTCAYGVGTGIAQALCRYFQLSDTMIRQIILAMSYAIATTVASLTIHVLCTSVQ